MTRFSERAKKNTRLGIDIRIAVIKARLAELKEERALYQRYARMGLNKTFCNRVIRALNDKIITRTQQLNRYLSRRARWKREGRI